MDILVITSNYYLFLYVLLMQNYWFSENYQAQTNEQESRKSTGENFLNFSPPRPSSSSREEKNAPEQTIVETPPTPSIYSPSNPLPEGDYVCLSVHNEALKTQELIYQDRILQKEREIQMKEKEVQEVKAKLEATTEAQAQMR